MKIPVFVSSPTTLSESQDAVRRQLMEQLDKCGLEPRALGRSDFAVHVPLQEVLAIAHHCSGGLVLGFTQWAIESGLSKPGTASEKLVSSVRMPTPWNHLEAGILYALKLPLLIFREAGVQGGIFDVGVANAFIQAMPPTSGAVEDAALQHVFMQWGAQAREHYYRV